MFKNYILLALRNYWKNRGYTLINILGLSIGIACFMGIFAYTGNELSYDRHHKDAENIFRVKILGEMSGTSFEAAVSGAPVGEFLFNELPEVTLFTRLIGYPRSILFEYNENKLYQEGIIYADTSFFDMFSYSVAGDGKSALREPYSLVMLESVATKYFGDGDPLGKVIKWDNTTDYTVRAVIKEPLKNSHIGFEVLVSRSSLYSDPRYESLYNNLFAFTNFNYLKCSTGSIEEMDDKINRIFQEHAGEDLKESGSSIILKLQPITSIHLRSNITHEIKQNGNLATVYIFIAVALLILVISSINYINLSVANSSTRRMEVGLKKIFGAQKPMLFFHFLGESIFLVIISFGIGWGLLQLLAPLFDSISDQPFKTILKDNIHWLSIVILIPFIGLLAGSYPAIYVTSLKPVTVLKGKNTAGKEKLFFRNAMIILQFAISIFLLSTTWFIRNQVSFMHQKDLGYNKENLIVMSLRNADMISRYPALKNELMSIPGISDVSASSAFIGSFNQRRGFYRDGYSRKDMMMILNLQVEDNFLDLMEIGIVEGRNFFPDAVGDENKIIVNETLVNEFGINDPVGKSFRLPQEGEEKDDIKLEIIGVCKDFHYASLHDKVMPLIIWKDPSLRRYLEARISGPDQKKVLDAVSFTWSSIYPDYPFEYFFQDERYNAQYKPDMNTNHVFIFFTVIAIFIACMGVFGLTAFTTHRRTKEIGIRKVFGADIPAVMKLVSRGYVVPFLTSAILSIPAAWYFANNWLQNFSYRISIGWYVFLLSPLSAFLVALIAINIRAYLAARKDPVDALRYE